MLDLASTGPRAARVHPRPRPRVAARSRATIRGSTARPSPSSRCTRARARSGWVAPEQIRKRGDARRAGDRSLRARLHHLPRAHRQRGLRGQRAGGPARAQAHARAAARRFPRACRAGVGAFVQRLLAKKPWHRFELAADARRVWAQFRPRTRRRSKRRSRARRCARRAEPSSTPGDGTRGRRGAIARAGPPLACVRRRWSRATTSAQELMADRAVGVCAGQRAARTGWSRSSARPASARAASPSGSASRSTSAG